MKPWNNRENIPMWGKWNLFFGCIVFYLSKRRQIEPWCLPACSFQLNGMENYPRIEQRNCLDPLNCLEMKLFIQAFARWPWLTVPLMNINSFQRCPISSLKHVPPSFISSKLPPWYDLRVLEEKSLVFALLTSHLQQESSPRFLNSTLVSLCSFLHKVLWSSFSDLSHSLTHPKTEEPNNDFKWLFVFLE